MAQPVKKASKSKARNDAAAWLRGEVRIEIDITAPTGVRLVRSRKEGGIACTPNRN